MTEYHRREYGTTDFDRQLRLQNAGLAQFELRCFAKYFDPDTRTLDLGTGGGRIALALGSQHHFTAVVAVDFVEGFVRTARHRAQEVAPRTQFAVANALELCFRDKTFDQIVAAGVLLSHLPNRDLRLKALSEMRRVLKVGGLAYVTVHNARRHFSLYGLRTFMRLVRAVRGNEQHYWRNDLPRLGSRAGRMDPLFWRRDKSHLHYYYPEEFVLDTLSSNLALIELNGFGPSCEGNQEEGFWRLVGAPSLQAVLWRRD
ncbi:MAG: class I SAM-dependent methyltransferase [Acidobacteriota bacterium]